MTAIPRLRIIEEPPVPRVVIWGIVAAVIGSYGTIFGKHYLALAREHAQLHTAVFECLNERPWVFKGDTAAEDVAVLCWRAKR